MNIACKGKVKKLYPKYNFVFNSYYGGMIGDFANSGFLYADKEEDFVAAQNDPVIVHFTRPKPWNNNEYGAFLTDESFDGWLNNFDMYRISSKLKVSPDYLNSQKETIVKKYYNEWKNVAEMVVENVYKNR